jgi:hypothetical protein
MKIQVEVEIFNDPEYCHDEKIECYYLEEFACRLYRTIIQCGKHKCPQCKEAWQKAQQGKFKPLYKNFKTGESQLGGECPEGYEYVGVVLNETSGNLGELNLNEVANG